MNRSFDDRIGLADISVEAAAGQNVPETFIALARRAETMA
jgi:hypothetical protein